MAAKGYMMVRDPASPYNGRWVNVQTGKPETMMSWGAAMPDQPTFEITTWVPGSTDIDMERVPQWCDLFIDLDRSNGDSMRMHLTRNAGEAIIESLHAALHVGAAVNVQEELWTQLDEITAALLDGTAEEDDRGRAQGLAMALAVIVNPYAPNVDSIRALALQRAGVEPETEDEPDPLWDALMPLGMVALQRLADEAPLPADTRWSRLGHDALVELLWTWDVGPDGPLPGSPLAPAEEPEPEDDEWGSGF
jgi:hypothetical protein